MLLLGPHIPFLHQVLKLISLEANLPMSLHLAPKYFATTKAASHTTQLTSTFFWHNVKDLPQLLISNFLIKIPTIFTCTLTSNSFN